MELLKLFKTAIEEDLGRYVKGPPPCLTWCDKLGTFHSYHGDLRGLGKDV